MGVGDVQFVTDFELDDGLPLLQLESAGDDFSLPSLSSFMVLLVGKESLGMGRDWCYLALCSALSYCCFVPCSVLMRRQKDPYGRRRRRGTRDDVKRRQQARRKWPMTNDGGSPGRCPTASDVEMRRKGPCTSAGGSWDWLLWFGCHGEGVNVIEDGTMARKIF